MSFRMHASVGIFVVAIGGGCDARRAGDAHDSVAPVPARDERARGTAHDCPTRAVRRYEPDAITRERDELLMWLAYAIAYDDWQDAGATARRGQNVAAVLADANGTPLCWSRNSAIAEGDATQHAEVRLLTSYLRSNPGTHADRLRLYATLEPCAMCAGMTLITGIDTVLYGEHAGPSGAVYERLAHDSHAEGGFCPYPYSLVAAAAPTDLVGLLDRARSETTDVRAWMESAGRRAIHERAARALDAYRPAHAENVEVLAAIRRFRASVPRTVPVAPYRIGCPSFEPTSEATP